MSTDIKVGKKYLTKGGNTAFVCRFDIPSSKFYYCVVNHSIFFCCDTHGANIYAGDDVVSPESYSLIEEIKS